MKNKKPVLGMIGAGMIAQEHLTNLGLTGGVTVRWVSDIRPDLCAEVARKFRIPRQTADYRQFLEDPAVDTVIIATPPFTHLEIFRDCVHAGKNVLIEKPACIHPSEADEMESLAGANPHLLIMDASGRHARLQPKFKKIRDMIASGILGDIYYIHHNSVARQFRPGIEYHPPAKWFLDKTMAGGGPFIDWGVYDLSFHLGILGDRPELVGADGFAVNGLDRKDPGTDIFTVEEHGAVSMTFTDGLHYYWERGSNANVAVPGETRIYGTRGGLKFSYITWETPEITWYYLDEKEKARQKLVRPNMRYHLSDHHAMMKHFVAVLKGKEQPVIPFLTALKHLRIIFRIYGDMKNVRPSMDSVQTAK